MARYRITTKSGNNYDVDLADNDSIDAVAGEIEASEAAPAGGAHSVRQIDNQIAANQARDSIPEMTAGSVARDIGAGLLKIGPTIVGGVGDLTRLATGDTFGKGLTDFAERGEKAIDEVVGSDRAAAQKAKFARDMADPNVSIGQALSDNKGAISDQILPTIGSMFIPAGAGAAAVKAASLLKIANAAKVATPAVVAATVGQNAGDTYSEIRDAGGDQADAYKGAGIAGAATAAMGGLTRGGFEGALSRRLAGASPAQTTLKQATLGALAAPLREGVQEIGEQVGQDVGSAVGKGEELNPLAMAKNAAVAGTLGAIVGGGGHVATGGLARTPVPAANFTPEDSLTAQAGLTPIVVPIPQQAGTPVDGTQQPAAAAGAAALDSLAAADAGSRERMATGLMAAIPPVDQGLGATQPAEPATEPAATWYGRRGDGYATEADAQQAIEGRRRKEPDLSWTVEQHTPGRYRLAGYPQTSAGAGNAVTPGAGPAMAGAQVAPAGDSAGNVLPPGVGLPGSPAVQVQPPGQEPGAGGVLPRGNAYQGVASVAPENVPGGPAMGPPAVASGATLQATQGELNAPQAATEQGAQPAAQGASAELAAPSQADRPGVAGASTVESAGQAPAGGGVLLGSGVGVRPAAGPADSGSSAPAPAFNEDRTVTVQRDFESITRARAQAGFKTPILSEVSAGDVIGARQAREFAQRTGMDLVFFKDEGDSNFSGVRVGNRMYIRNDPQTAPIAVAVHEAWHGLPADIKAKWTDAIRPTLRNRERFELVFPYKDGDVKGDGGLVEEEMIAFMAGAHARKKAFWSDLANKVGDREFASLAKEVIVLLKGLITSFRRDSTKTYSDNPKLVLDALTSAFAEVNARLESAQSPAAGPQEQASFAMDKGREEVHGDYKVRVFKDGSISVPGDGATIRALMPENIKGRITPNGMDFTNADAPRVRAALDGRNIAYSRAGEVTDKLPMKDGKYLGAPKKYDKPGNISILRKSLMKLAREGEDGRFWYENSGKAVLRMTGGDVHEARKFVALCAIYSPQAKVDTNSTFALRAWAQYKAGHPIKVKTAVMDKKAKHALDDVDAFWSGEKTGNFFFNLLREIDPSTEGKQGATIDMWMMRAAEYENDAPTKTQYAFMENETNRIAAELGWEPQQVQAAIWVAMKARMENAGVKKATEAKSAKKGWIHYTEKINPKTGKAGKGVRVIDNAQAHRDNWLEHAFRHDPTTSDTKAAKYDFENGVQAHIGQISWEARPSRSVAAMQGVNDAPYDVQVEYQQAIQKALYDETTGADLLAQQLGLLVDGEDLLAPGAWQGEITAGMQKQVAMAPVAGGERLIDTNTGSEISEADAAAIDSEWKKSDRFRKLPRVDDGQSSALNTYAAVLGLGLKQDGVGWHRPFFTVAKMDANGREFRIGRAPTPQEMRAVYDAVEKKMLADGKPDWQNGLGLISSPSGVRIVSFGAIDNESLQSKEFAKVVGDALPDSVAVGFASHGDMPSNDWKENPDGQGYRSRISKEGRPDVLGWAATVLAPRLQAVNEDFAKRYGWGDPGTVSFSEDERPAEPARGSRAGSDESSGRGRRIRGAVHYSTQGGLSVLSGRSFGSGIRGAEQERLADPTADPRIKRRVYFYLPTQGGIPAPEAGLGGHVYTADLGNLYDSAVNPFIKGATPNAFESAILDAGYNGYVNREQGTAVVLNNDVPVKYVGPASAQTKVQRNTERIVHKVATRQEGDELVRRVGNDEMMGVIKARPTLTKVAPSFKLQYGEARVLATEAPAANAALAEHGGPQFSEDRADDVSPIGFFSELARKVQGGPGKAMPDQWKAYIRGLTTKGVKPDEIQWSGIEDWLAMQTGKVSKEAVSEFLRGNGVRVSETTLSDGRLSGPEAIEMRELSDLERRMDDGEEGAISDDELARLEELRAKEEDNDEPSATKYGQYTLPGGTNYREVLLTLPTNGAGEMPAVRVEPRGVYEGSPGGFNTYIGDQFMGWGETEQASKMGAIKSWHGRKTKDQPKYVSNHWDQPNILAHIRMNDRADADGKKVLFVEELQSDWGQDGKKGGFRPQRKGDEMPPGFALYDDAEDARQKGFPVKDGETGPWFYKGPGIGSKIYKSREAAIDAAWSDAAGKHDSRPPSAPFVTKTEGWLSLGLKRVIKLAVDEGYDKVAFVTGKQSAERYDLSKQLDEVLIQKNGPNGSYLVTGRKDGREVLRKTAADNAELADTIGKELAEKGAAQTKRSVTYSGLDLAVGGEGMTTFYDQIVPNAVKGLLKKLGGGSIGMVNIGQRYDVVRTDVGQRPTFEVIDNSARGEYSPPVFSSFSKEEAERWLKDHADMLAQPGFEITPAMRAAAGDGLPMFAFDLNSIRKARPKPPVMSKSSWLLGRDEIGRVRLGAGAKLYRKIADFADGVLALARMKPISQDLSRALRVMKNEVDKARDRTAVVAEHMSRLTEAQRKTISDIVEKEVDRDGQPSELLELADKISAIMGKQTDELIEVGMLSQEAADKWRDKYLPRFYEGKGGIGEVSKDLWAKAVSQMTRKPAVLTGIGGKSLKRRGMVEVVKASQVGKYIADGWAIDQKDYDPKAKAPVQMHRDYTMEERESMKEIRDASFRFVMGYMRSQKDLALGRLYAHLSETIASKHELEGYVRVPDSTVDGTSMSTYGKLGGMYVPKEVMDHLSNFDEAGDMLKLYRKALSLWKEGKVVLNPVSHMNNVLSNVSMAHFAGVSYWDQHKYAAAAKDFSTGGGRMAEAKDAGLFGGTMTDVELREILPKEMQLLLGKAQSKGAQRGSAVLNALTFGLRNPMGKAYEAEDMFFRYLIYKEARDRGLHENDAIDYAQKFIFTYDDLPQGARFLRDSALPFFAYTYKVIPILAETALSHPWRMAAPAAVAYAANAAMYAIAAGGDDDEWYESLKKWIMDSDFRKKASELEDSERTDLPEWLKGRSALGTQKSIRLWKDETTGLPVFLDAARIVPGGDLFDVNNNSGGIPWLQPITPSHPLFSIGAMAFANKDMYFGKDIVDKNDTKAEAAEKRAMWLYGQIAPAVMIGNYHFNRAMQAAAYETGKEFGVPGYEYTGFGKDGLPTQAGYAIAQTFGLKARPIDLDASADITKNQLKSLARGIKAEMKAIRRLEDRGAISGNQSARQLETAQTKLDRIRDGLDVDGNETD